MWTVEPKSLFKHLNATCKRALEIAAQACVRAHHYEVTVEHFLNALLEDQQSDVAAVLEHYRVSPTLVISALSRALGDQRSGNPGRPVFSSRLLNWFEEALLYATVELGEPQIRSGALLVRLVASPAQYLPVELPFLNMLPKDELRQELLVLASTSAESGSAQLASHPQTQDPLQVPAQGSALERFTSDLTAMARANKLDPVFGREPEIRQMIEILVRRRKNNPILVGEAGVGKTALAEGLAMRIAEGSVPDELRTARLVALDLGALQAGAGVRGEFEGRLRGVLTEIKASTVPILLFIDEAHSIIGAGAPQGGSDAANLLKPALARGELRTIAATTYAEFKRYFEKDAALERRFQPVRVEEPSIDMAILMLRGLAERFHHLHGVVIRDEAVRASVELSSRYISGRQLPDKAVDLLDTATAHVKLVRAAPPGPLEGARAALAAVERELKAYQRDECAGVPVDNDARRAAETRRKELELSQDRLEAAVAEQRAIVDRIETLRAKQVGPEGENDEQAVAIRRQELENELSRLNAIPATERWVTADVDESVVATVVSEWTGIPIGKMVKDDLAALLSMEDRLRERVRGQDRALAVIANEIRAARSGLKAPNAPLGVFLLVGPSGTGKTETALALADLLFGGERFVVTINMSEFQERHTVSRLIGSPPGYVGFGEGGILTQAVRHRPYSVVLLDEVEKADREVLSLFYQVFDKGMLADGEGRVVDFKNTVLILTSNLGTELLTQATSSATPAGRDMALEANLGVLVDLVKPTLSQHFKPALLARMTVVPYVPLGPQTLREITELKLRGLAERVRGTHGIELTIPEDVVTTIAQRCHEVDSGARNVDHILRGTVLPLVSTEILRSLVDEVPLAAGLELAVDDHGQLHCTTKAAGRIDASVMDG